MTNSPRRSPSPSIIKRRAARLAFVQYIYQQKLEGGPKPIQRYSDDIAARVLEQDAEDPAAEPDFKFLRKLLEGFASEQAAVQNRLTAQMASGRAFDRVSPMMQSLLEAASYELLYFPEVKKNIVLDEYVSIAAEFFDNPELGFVNGTIQQLADSLKTF